MRGVLGTTDMLGLEGHVAPLARAVYSYSSVFEPLLQAVEDWLAFRMLRCYVSGEVLRAGKPLIAERTMVNVLRGPNVLSNLTPVVFLQQVCIAS